MASLRALAETDMKKIVALSTLRQLGLMFSALGLGASGVAFFHLLTHAFFKAIIFISVGNLIHLSSDYQDLRKIQNCPENLKFTLSIRIIANIRLCGLPFLSGFYSKDLILELISSKAYGGVIVLAYYLSVALTVLYSIRFVLSVALTPASAGAVKVREDSDMAMFFSILTLYPLAIIAGSGLAYLLIRCPANIVVPLENKNLTLVIIILAARAYRLIPAYSRQVCWSWGRMWSLPFIRSYAFNLTALSLRTNITKIEII
jgi:NADH-ubiquinone oxidoreductase chain 5